MTILDTMVLPLLMIVVTPLFIKELTLEVYGVWMLINSLLHAFSMMNIGGVDTVIKFVAEHTANGREEKANEVFGTVFVSQILLACLLCLLAFIAPEIVEKFKILNIESSQIEIFKLSFKFGIFIFSLKLIEQLSLSYFKGYERFDLASYISIFSKFIIVIVQVVTVLMTNNLVKVFEYSFYAMISLVLFELIMVYFYSGRKNLFFSFNLNTLKEVLNYTGWSWATSLIGTFSTQVDRWLIGSLANMKALALYSVCLLVFNNLHSITSASMQWVFPRVSKSSCKSELLINTKFNIYLVLLLSIMGCSFLIFFEEIFLFWLKEDLFREVRPYMLGFLKILPIYALSIIPFFSLKGQGHIKEVFWGNITTLVLRSLGMMILYKYFELIGVVYAIAISGFVLSLYLIFSMNKKVFDNEKTGIILYVIPAVLFYFANHEVSFIKIPAVLMLVSFMFYFFPRAKFESLYNLR